jgi:BlaI family penicillinase repressor
MVGNRKTKVMPEYPISDAEWLILQAIWDGQPASAEDVVKRLERKTRWHDRTIKTMLHRLVKKGILAFKKDGRRYLYSPRVSREACVRQASRSFLERVFGGAVTPAILHIVEEAKLSRPEIERLKAILSGLAEGKEKPK